MPITKQGWELHVVRQRMHKKGSRSRTYGTYEVTIDGKPQPGLSGFIAESVGPGDNATPENGKRVEAGRYPLATQFGKYKTIGFSDAEEAGAKPMPALLLLKTNKRTGILIHPSHPPKLFLSSVGCFNPTSDVGEDQDIDFFDSRKRTVALIQSLEKFAPGAFTAKESTAIPNAAIVVDGEPA